MNGGGGGGPPGAAGNFGGAPPPPGPSISPVGAVASPIGVSASNSVGGGGILHQHNPSSANAAAKYMQLNVTLERAEITGAGGFIRPDPYVEVSVDGKPPKKTDTYRNSFRPKWHCDISVIVTCYSKLVFRVYNHSTFKKDALIGQASLDLFSVLKQTNGKYKAKQKRTLICFIKHNIVYLKYYTVQRIQYRFFLDKTYYLIPYPFPDT